MEPRPSLYCTAARRHSLQWTGNCLHALMSLINIKIMLLMTNDLCRIDMSRQFSVITVSLQYETAVLLHYDKWYHPSIYPDPNLTLEALTPCLIPKSRMKRFKVINARCNSCSLNTRCNMRNPAWGRYSLLTIHHPTLLLQLYWSSSVYFAMFWNQDHVAGLFCRAIFTMF